MSSLARPRLRPGSRVALVSPAGSVAPERLQAGQARLRSFGYEPVLMPHAAERGPLYFAGTEQQRADDLMAAFADDTVDGVLCTRGGWGSAELLPLLDAALVRAHPKVFVGYSDITSLHSWLWNECGLPTVHGPMVAADWAREDGVDARTWMAVVQGEGDWCVDAQDGVQCLRPGAVQGRLLGGCLAMLEAALGTRWALRLTEPTVLFLEDINVKPYQWDRALQHLRWAGVMEQVVGVVFGDGSACVPPEQQGLLQAACLHGLGGFAGPVLMGLQSGHMERANRSVPLGAWVQMNEAGLREIGTHEAAGSEAASSKARG